MIPFNDLKAQQEKIKEHLNKRIETVLDHGQYIMGPEIQELEEWQPPKTVVQVAIFHWKSNALPHFCIETTKSCE